MAIRTFVAVVMHGYFINLLSICSVFKLICIVGCVLTDLLWRFLFLGLLLGCLYARGLL